MCVCLYLRSCCVGFHTLCLSVGRGRECTSSSSRLIVTIIMLCTYLNVNNDGGVSLINRILLPPSSSITTYSPDLVRGYLLYPFTVQFFLNFNSYGLMILTSAHVQHTTANTTVCLSDCPREFKGESGQSQKRRVPGKRCVPLEFLVCSPPPRVINNNNFYNVTLYCRIIIV